MTKVVLTVGEDAALGDIVALMEKHRVKRLPVMRGERLVGIVSRANLLHALAAIAGEIGPAPQSDEAIRNRVIAELDRPDLGAAAPDRRHRAKRRRRIVGLGFRFKAA
jgi:CBS domain-containing protein